MKKILICADDFGISPGVSEAIIDLINRKAITACACISVMPESSEHAKSLQSIKIRPDIGLHLCLTDVGIKVNGTRLPSFKTFLRRAFLGQISFRFITRTINTQLDMFESQFNETPDFIDGHQYVHQLPIVRDALISIVKNRYKVNRPYLRNTHIGFSKILKMKTGKIRNTFISIQGRYFKKLLRSHQIKTNKSFSGIYNFTSKKTYKECFLNFIEMTEERGMIVTHPGLVDKILLKRDRLTSKREEEYEFLRSNDFQQILKSADINLTRFFDT